MNPVQAFVRDFPRIHLLGASGSGTSTLGKALAQACQFAHFDADDFFWLPSDPPFRHKRPIAERQHLLQTQVLKQPNWVLSGSLCGWGDPLIPHFSLVLKLQLDPAIRLERLLLREKARYGEQIAPGGAMYQTHQDFIAWARQYDTGNVSIRSEKMHRAWLQTVSCPVLALETQAAVADLIQAILANPSKKDPQ